MVSHRFRSGIPLVKIKITPKLKKRNPQTNRLSKVFHNWTYAGWVFSEKANIPPKTVRGNWEAIVTTEEFEHGLAILDRRNHKPDNHYRHNYLLKAMLYVKYPQSEKLTKLTCSISNASRPGGGTSYYCIKSSNINILCRVLDPQVEEHIKQIQVEPDMIPILRECYHADLQNKLGHLSPDEKDLIEQELDNINREEERTLRLFASGKVSEEIWSNLWKEWQDQRQKLTERMESLEKKSDFHISNLDSALHIISKIGVLYDGLNFKQKRNLLRDVVDRVVVDPSGNILRVELKSPFAYLKQLKDQVK